MLEKSDFRQYAHEMVDWIADYYENIENYPVKSQVKPREIFNKLPVEPPMVGESMDDIMNDFKRIIIPGVTHWQSPNFYAYFPANASFPSILAEFLTAGLGLQCMKWDTSPAAAELEERVMDWLRQMIALPPYFTGVIQDTASTSTLCAILSAREKYSSFSINQKGFSSSDIFRVYCSAEAHSSVEKAVKIAGIGKDNLVKISVDSRFALNVEMLEKAIVDDIQQGFKPLCVIAAIGSTGSTAIDPLDDNSEITQKYNIWLHVDAAMAGSAMILPEMHWMIAGVENADSFVFNPHKWLFTNFDCSAYFVKDKETLIRTFELIPEYLKTRNDAEVNNYCDWGIQLGRRFRALKLWFVIRNFGLKKLRESIRKHIELAKNLADEIAGCDDFEVITPVTINLVCFRYISKKNLSEEAINQLNEKLLTAINASGKIYLSHTKLGGKYTLRMQIGQTYVEKKHVDAAWELIKTCARENG